MNLDDLSKLLSWLGHMQPGESIQDALKKYQSFHGLNPTGVLDDTTAVQLKLPRCGHPDVMAMGTGVCKWPMNQVTWFQAVQLAQLPADRVQAVFALAHQQWADVCGIQPTNVADSSQANITARAGSGPADQLDGPGGILAYSELPCGVAGNTQLHQVFDADENWVESMLLAVACHEIGHAYGLQHSTTGNLMAPYYNPAITKPQAGDIQEMVARYGPPQPKPTPTPSPSPVDGEIVIPAGVQVIAGKTFVVTITLTPR